MFKIPVVTLTGPLKVLAPLSTMVPEPALVSPVAVVPSEMTPPTVNVEDPPVVMVRVVPGPVPSETAPVPRFRECEPVKVKSTFQVSEFTVLRLIAPAELLSITPPLMVSALLPRAVALLMLSVPAFKTVPPAAAA